MADECHIECFRGESPVFPIRIRDVNLTGVDLRFRVYVDYGDANFIDRTVGSGITLVSAAGGTAEVTLTADQTDVTPGTYNYVLGRYNSTFERVYSYGTIKIKRPRIE